MSRGSWLWEGPFVVFCEVWRLRASDDRGRELREVGSDECLEGCGPGRLHLSYSTRFGGSGEVEILTNLLDRVGALKQTNTPGASDSNNPPRQGG